jgi:hypothetical protein
MRNKFEILVENDLSIFVFCLRNPPSSFQYISDEMVMDRSFSFFLSFFLSCLTTGQTFAQSNDQSRTIGDLKEEEHDDKLAT